MYSDVSAVKGQVALYVSQNTFIYGALRKNRTFITSIPKRRSTI